jgi:chorismate mutase
MICPSKIDAYRAQIDNIDNQILNLLNKRFQLCKQIGEEKAKGGLAIKDKRREEEIYDRLKNNEEFQGLVSAIWPNFIEFATNLQK